MSKNICEAHLSLSLPSEKCEKMCGTAFILWTLPYLRHAISTHVTTYIAFRSFKGGFKGGSPFSSIQEFKGTFSPVQICLEVTKFNGTRIGHMLCLIFLKTNCSFNFYWAFEVLKQPTPNTYVTYHFFTEWRILLILAALRLLCPGSLTYTPRSLTNQNQCNLTLDQPECSRCFCPVPSGDGISSKSNRSTVPDTRNWMRFFRSR
jgi:hypothetical protein